MRRLARTGFAVAAVVCLFAAIVPMQRSLTSLKTADWFQQRMSFLPRSDVLKPMLLGFETTYANYLWFKTVNYFGSHYITDRSFPWLVQMVDMVTRLNPWFEPAYEFAGVLLPDLAGAPEASEVILERGMFYLGKRSYKPFFYAGVLRLKFDVDKKVAAAYVARAAMVPSEHSWKLAKMASTFYAQAGDVDDAERYLKFMLETTSDPLVKRVVADRLEALQKTGG